MATKKTQYLNPALTPKRSKKQLKAEDIPTTQFKQNLDRILTYGVSIPHAQKDIKADVQAKENKILITFPYSFREPVTHKHIAGTMSFAFPNMQTLKSDNASVNKLLNHFFSKMFQLVELNEDGTPATDSFEISTHELVELGMYKNIDAANAGLDKFNLILRDLQITYGMQTKGKAYTTEVRLYHTYRRKNATAIFELYKEAKLKDIYTYMTKLPLFSYKLSGRAALLLTYILTMARNTDQKKRIADNGYFMIDISSIITELGLPPLEGNRNPKRLIKTPIIDALEEITEAYADEGFSNGFEYNIVSKQKDLFFEGEYLTDKDGNYAGDAPEQPVKEWVKNQVKITFRGALRDYYINLTKGQRAMINLKSLSNGKDFR